MRLRDQVWLGHAGLALLIQAVVGLAGMALWRASGSSVLLCAYAGAMAGVWFYIGRERKQAESRAGSRAIAPWDWSCNRRALRDIGWPAVATGAAAALAWRLSAGVSS